MKKVLMIVTSVIFLAACSNQVTGTPAATKPSLLKTPKDSAKATFAGGCFWCMEKPFEKLNGVYSVISGYAGGPEKNPTYKQVAGGRTGHTEVVQVVYDPNRVSYETLLEVYWRQTNPTDLGGQFVDRGSQYRPEIFYHDDAQKEAAEKSKAALQASGRFDKPIVTPITAFTNFYPAEEYHQDFYIKSPDHYNRYRRGSGRDAFIKKYWGDEAEFKQPKMGAWLRPSDAEIKKRLTRIQYNVTQKDGTERPFKNKYWDNKKAGIYVDIVSGEPLFSSTHKYKSGTGWPSFYQPLVPNHIVEHSDYKLGYLRSEVRSRYADSHLGHVFPDGPLPSGQRYCINSAALRFVPVKDMAKEGYDKYLYLFEGVSETAKK